MTRERNTVDSDVVKLTINCKCFMSLRLHIHLTVLRFIELQLFQVCIFIPIHRLKHAF